MYFVVFVLLAQFVLVNVVVAVLMKHLEESHKFMEEDEDYEIDMDIDRELAAEKKAFEEASERKRREDELRNGRIRRCLLTKVSSLPANFTFSEEGGEGGEEGGDSDGEPGDEVQASRAPNVHPSALWEAPRAVSGHAPSIQYIDANGKKTGPVLINIIAIDEDSDGRLEKGERDEEEGLTSGVFSGCPTLSPTATGYHQKPRKLSDITLLDEESANLTQ
jgi:hypothetical protein